MKESTLMRDHIAAQSVARNSSSQVTGDEPFKSICRILGPRAKKPTLGSQHAVEAGYLKCMCLFVLAFY